MTAHLRRVDANNAAQFMIHSRTVNEVERDRVLISLVQQKHWTIILTYAVPPPAAMSC
jgi:hypothetical protein